MQKRISLQKIIQAIGNDVINIHGNIEGVYVDQLSEPQNTTEHTLDWVNKRKLNAQQIAEDSIAKTIIVTEAVAYTEQLRNQEKVLIVVNNPKMAIAKVGHAFFVDKLPSGIASSAVIAPEAKIGNNVHIGANCYIGKVVIGDHVEIHANAVLYDNVEVHNNVIINAGAVIGTDGLGCEREADGTLVKFPHFGGVIIGNNVEIGANSQIARGALSNTIIGNGSKINVGCYIAHNTILGENVWVSAQAKIAGSCKIMDNVTIYMGVCIREQRTIGKLATVGMGSVVTKNIPENETWIGNPAKKLDK